MKYTGSLNFATIENFVEKLILIVPPTEPKRKKVKLNYKKLKYVIMKF